MGKPPPDYANGDLGRWTCEWVEWERSDDTPVKLGAWQHPKATRVQFTSALLGTQVLDIRVSRNGYTVDVVELRPRGRAGVTPAYLERLSREWLGILRMSVLWNQRVTAVYSGWDYPDTLREQQDLWTALLQQQHPRQQGESRDRYYLRLYEQVYLPAGVRQDELAQDLGITVESLRVSLSRARKGQK